MLWRHVQWDAVENKTSVVIYGVGAVAVVWLSSSLVGAVNNIPLVRSPHLGYLSTT